MSTISDRLSSLPLLARGVVVGAISLGTIGGLVGLIVGLRSNVPTAPFAVVELGLPAAVLGGVVGLLAVLIVAAGRGVKGDDR